MFADPQSVTYNAAVVSLPRIGSTADASTYMLNSSGAIYNLLLGHQFKARNRAFARLRLDAYSADPIIPANNSLASMTASITIDYPQFGVTADDARNLGKALVAWATDANLLKLVNGEN